MLENNENDKEKSSKLSKKLFNFCKNCPFEKACISPFIEDVGDFDKINEIDNNDVSEWIVNLYNEINDYKFELSKYSDSKEQQKCLLRKLTMAINLIGSANMSFNKIKDENK